MLGVAEVVTWHWKSERLTVARMECNESTVSKASLSILGEELALLEGQHIDISLRTAHLMPSKIMENYYFSFLAFADRERVDTPEFINRKEVVHFLGPPGASKPSRHIRQTTVKAGDSITEPCSGQPRVPRLSARRPLPPRQIHHASGHCWRPP